MKKFLLFIVGFLLVSTSLFAQEKTYSLHPSTNIKPLDILPLVPTGENSGGFWSPIGAMKINGVLLEHNGYSAYGQTTFYLSTDYSCDDFEYHWKPGTNVIEVLWYWNRNASSGGGTKQFSYTIHVNAPTFEDFPTLTDLDPKFNLWPYATPQTNWKGNFITSGVAEDGKPARFFDPQASGIGDFTVTAYMLCNSKTYEWDHTITVEKGATINLSFTEICKGENPKTLTGGSPAGGTYHINGSEVTTLNPDLYSSGIIQVSYRYGSGVATQDVYIHNQPNVTLSDFDSKYVDDPEFSLTGGSPEDGNYYVNNILTTKVNPQTLGKGVHTIKYTVTNSNNCSTSVSKTITILGLENGEDIPNKKYCKSDPAVLLYPLNGGKITINGTEVTNGIFDPSKYDAGSYTAIYSKQNYEDEAFTITVHANPSVTFSVIDESCENEAKFSLIGKVNPTTGVFGGTGISGNDFAPSVAKSGNHQISYTVTDGNGCSTTVNQVATVHSITTPTLAVFDPICNDADPKTLTGGLPTGGKYYVNGQLKAEFDPKAYSPGQQRIDYTFTNANGCSSTATRYIEVLASPSPTLTDRISKCENDAPFKLEGGSPSGGVYSCPTNPTAIASGTYYPTLSGDGNFPIRYTVTNSNGCSAYVEKSQVILEAPNVTITSLTKMCQNEPEKVLSGGKPLGGKYYIDGILATKIVPLSLTKGTHLVRYVYELPNGCSDFAETTLVIQEAPIVSLNPFPEKCQNDGILVFSGGSPSGSGGSYYIEGLKKSQIDLADYPAGDYTIRYEYDNGNCVDYAETTLTINATPNVTLNTKTKVCKEEGSFTLSGGAPLGGKYFIDGIEKTQMDPLDYIEGPHTITYTVTNSKGCEESVSKTINVYNTPTVTISDYDAVCNNGSIIPLTGGFPEGGKYYVNNVEKSELNPKLYTAGDHTIRYVYTNANGCSASASTTITIHPLAVVTLSDRTTKCENEAPFKLEGGSPSGGVYSCPSNPTAIASGTYYPTLSGDGNFPVRYTVTNEHGCISYAEKSQVILEAPNVSIAKFDPVCNNENKFVLTGGLPIGGKYYVNGIEKTEFVPLDYTAGTHKIEYEYSLPNGCSDRVETPIVVYSITTPEIFIPVTVCENEDPIELIGSPSGGSWVCPGLISGNRFDPITAGIGEHTAIYTFTNSNGCTVSKSGKITVVPSPNVIAPSLLPVCTNAGPISLPDGSPANGTWSGPGVIGDKFFPSVGEGEYTLTYSTSQANCSASATTKITVTAVPDVTLDAQPDVCLESGSYNLKGGLPVGGKYYVNGIETTTINPLDYGAVTVTVRYEVTVGSCTDFEERSLRILASPTVTAKTIPDVCENGNLVDLTSYGTPSGGTWSGPGVINNYLYPNISGVGDHNLTYTFKNTSGCSSSAQTVVKVEAEPNVSLTNKEVCIDEDPFVMDLANVEGGKYFINGNEVVTFDPAVFGSGNFKVIYKLSVGSCSTEVEGAITVHAKPSVTLSDFSLKSVEEGEFTLGGGYPTGGKFYVDGVEHTSFDPSKEGVGDYIIRYEFTNSNACSSFVEKTLTVVTPPSVSIGSLPSLCIDSEPVELTGGSPSGGTYSGTGVSNGTFYASLAGPGAHAITYTYRDANGFENSITDNIVVFDKPTVSLEEPKDLCITEAPILPAGGLPQGGKYLVDDVEVSEINAVNLGEGEHILRYEFTNANGCTNYIEKRFTVFGLPTVTLEDFDAVCYYSDAKTLKGGFPTGGAYFVNNNPETEFDPLKFGPGEHSIRYEYVNANGCKSSATKKITILTPATVEVTNPGILCEDAQVNLLPLGLPSGGVWSGTGVTDNKFIAGLVEPGTYTLTYTFTSSGCPVSKTMDVVVKAKPEVTLPEIDDVCINGTAITLSGGLPEGGEYFVDGKKTNEIVPTSLTLGLHTVRYEVISPEGCAASIEKTFRVNDLPVVTLQKQSNVCINDEAFNLSGGYPIGGKYYVNGTLLTKFDPILNGAGDYILRYEYTDGNGCPSFAEENFTVYPLPVVATIEIDPICIDGSPVDLESKGIPEGGKWSGIGTSAGKFFASIAGIGGHTLTYTYTDPVSGCSANAELNITVVDLPKINLPEIPDFCKDADPYTLKGATPLGGKYFLDGKEALEIVPTTLDAGIHTIRYDVVSAEGCTSSVETTFRINELPKVSLFPFYNQCLGDFEFTLDGGYPSGGTYYVNGVQMTKFDPEIEGPGNYTVRYVYTNSSGCSSFAEESFKVYEEPKVKTIPIDPICIDGSVVNLNSYAIPTGGTWSGNGTSANNFYPSLAGVGGHTLYYEYIDPISECSTTVELVITVVDKPKVKITDTPDFCIDSDPYTLKGATPAGGKFYINGVEATEIIPAALGEGLHSLRYEVVSTEGCTSSVETAFRVHGLPEVTLQKIEDRCIADDEFVLNGGYPSGGKYLVNGTQLSKFNPLTNGPGSYTVRYVYTNNNGCTSFAEQTFIVNAKPDVATLELNPICIDGEAVNLASHGIPEGGKWSGPGTSNGNFYASLAGIGGHTLIYTYTDPVTGCSNSAELNITVVDLPNVSLAPQDDYCIDNGTIVFKGGLPIGGKYFLNGIETKEIDAATLGEGSHTLEYRVVSGVGCEASAQTNFRVYDKPEVTLIPIGDVCHSDEEFPLSGGFPTGGTYYVNGVIMAKFNPKTFGPGSYTVRYEYTNANGCSSFKEETFRVNELPEVSTLPINPLCVKSETIDLKSYGVPEGGQWTGNGVISNYFLPSIAKGGNHTLTYTYQDPRTGCSNTATLSVSVIDLPVLTLPVIEDLCIDADPITLTGATPENGKYYIDGNEAIEILPLDLGVGLHTLAYEAFAMDGCGERVETTFRIYALPDVSLQKQSDLCVTEGEFILAGGYPTGGKYFVNGELMAKFNPQLAGPGTYTLRYEFTNGNGCFNYKEQVFKVNALPTVETIAIDPVCIESTEIDLTTYGKPEGGNWYGTGVTNNKFYSSIAKEGDHILTYTYQDPITGCSNSATLKMTVVGLPKITIPEISDFCIDSDPSTLTGAIPTGGKFYINGVEATEIVPTALGVGLHTLAYEAFVMDGCGERVETTFRVHELPTVSLQKQADVCITENEFTLNGGYPTGGQYFVNGELMAKFDPQLAGPGTYKLRYEYTNANGCFNFAEETFVVNALPEVSTIAIKPLCVDGGSVDLMAYSTPVGGKWSGSGTSANSFYPSIAGVGDHTLVYTYSDPTTGCTNSAELVVTVVNKPKASLPEQDDLCIDSAPVTLKGGTPSGGKYYINDIEASEIVPLTLGAGVHTIRYEVVSLEGCSSFVEESFRINDLPQIKVYDLPQVCEDYGQVNMTPYVYPSGGVWTGKGIKGTGIFDSEVAGAGTHELTYTYSTDLGCTTTIKVNMIVNPKPIVEIAPLGEYCEEEGEVDLSLYGSPTGGVWSGTGVVDNKFYTNVGAGIYNLTYTFENESGCSATTTAPIQVFEQPKVYLNEFDTYCSNSSAFVLTGGQPEGGYYSINGKKVTTFDPFVYGAGEYKVRYTVETENGCSSYAEKVLQVFAAPNVTLDLDIDEICQNGEEFVITGGFPEGGKYYLNDNQITTFDPKDYIAGVYNIEYRFEQTNGCGDKAIAQIKVLGTPEEPMIETSTVYCPGAEIKLQTQSTDLQVSWYREDLTKLEDDSESLIIQSNEPFTAFVQYCNTNGCKSIMKRVDVNVETISSNIEANEFQVEQGTPVQLESNVKTSGDVSEYYWEFSDGSTSYEKNPWHYFNAIGENSVKLSVQTINGCSYSQEVTGIIEVVAKTIDDDDDTDTQDNIDQITPDQEETLTIGSINPNPASERFYISTTGRVDAMIQIYSINGTLVYSKKMTMEGRMEINVSNLTPGLYPVMVIDTETNQIISKQKLIKK